MNKGALGKVLGSKHSENGQGEVRKKLALISNEAAPRAVLIDHHLASGNGPAAWICWAGWAADCWPWVAAAAFRKALQKPDSAAAAARLHFTLASGGKADEARQFADGWLQQHPDDLGFRFHLGDMARNGGDLVAAEARYREVLKRLPDNVMALNNVAEVLLRQKKPGAVALAQRAVTLAPNRPALMDTLAMSYAGDNQLDKALDLQRQVVAQSPRSAVFRLNLARLQLQAGDKDGARAELDKLARLGSSFDGQAQVQQLLKDLGT